MANIESPLGKVSYSSGTKKVLTVEDQSSGQPEVHSFSSNNISDEEFESRFTQEELDEMKQLTANRDQLKNSRKEAAIQRNRIPEGLKKRLEILAGIGRLSEDVVVDGVTFSIRSLKPKESQEVTEAMIQKNTQAEQALVHRTQTMARSIYKIDGQNISSVIESDAIDSKINFIQEVLEESLVNFLYNKYHDILAKNKEKFNDLGKTGEEVIENVKKS
jgi:hypothetical protein